MTNSLTDLRRCSNFSWNTTLECKSINFSRLARSDKTYRSHTLYWWRYDFNHVWAGYNIIYRSMIHKIVFELYNEYLLLDRGNYNYCFDNMNPSGAVHIPSADETRIFFCRYRTHFLMLMRLWMLSRWPPEEGPKPEGRRQLVGFRRNNVRVWTCTITSTVPYSTCY